MKRRLVIFFLALLAFIAILGLSFVLDIFAVKADLSEIEDFYGLFNNTLEVRRYEKNVLFGLGEDSYRQLMHYIDTVEQGADRLHISMSQAVGEDVVRGFEHQLKAYRSRIEEGKRLGVFDEETIRHHGQELVLFTQELLRKKRIKIHEALHQTTFVFLGSMAAAFVAVLLVFYFQARTILLRLALLREATVDVAAGKFLPIREPSGTKDELSGLIVAFNRMVQELDVKQEQLLQSRKLAAIGTFSSGIAHELNNPLNNISLTADTLREEFDHVGREEALELIDDVIRQADRASNVVKHLLDFSREPAPAETVLNIKDVLNGTVRLVRNQLRLQNTTLEDFVPENLPSVRGDAHKLEQVFLNLFLNSIHAIGSGGLIYMEGRVDPQGFVRVDFVDTGSGIPAEALDHIFEPFYTTKPVGQGTGLGLSIVYGIIKKYGGYVEVKSKVMGGTTFSVFLPIADETPEIDHVSH